LDSLSGTARRTGQRRVPRIVEMIAMAQRQTFAFHPAKLLVVIIVSLMLWLLLWLLASSIL